ncbi:Obg family GTPase CgtA, partial [Candidatus Saccharibacteria bacterium]|nr:Obg family GTPase CgtA [Candidatus Saccharibacteria bacterium]
LKDRPEVIALTKCEGVDEDIIKLQMSSILEKNPDAKIYAISSKAHEGLTELLRELKRVIAESDQVSFANSERTRAESEELTESSTGQYWAQTRISSEDSARREAKCEQNELDQNRREAGRERNSLHQIQYDIPTISLSKDTLKNTWKVEKLDDKFVVTGEKIEKFARRTDLNNYASVNRLRDIMKKLGIRAELTSQGAEPDSIISIAGKEFPLVEEW